MTFRNNEFVNYYISGDWVIRKGPNNKERTFPKLPSGRSGDPQLGKGLHHPGPLLSASNRHVVASYFTLVSFFL